MLNTILIESLRLIKPEEWKEFEKFAASPYFNKGRKYLPLLKLLKKFHPDFDDEKLTKKFLYKKLYNSDSYKEGVMNTLLSGLNNLANEFFIQENFKTDKLRDLSLLNELSSRGDKKRAEIIYKKMLRDNEANIDNTYYYNKYKIHLEFYNHLVFVNENKRCLNERVLFLYNLILHAVLVAYISGREFFGLRFDSKVNFDNSRKLISSIDSEGILKVLKDTKMENSNFWLIDIYKEISYCYKNSDSDDRYFNLKNLILDNFELFSIPQKSLLLSNLSGISLEKNNAGKSSFEKESFEILKFKAEKNLIKLSYRDKYIKMSVIRSIINGGIKYESFSWVENFLKKYSSQIEKKNRAKIINFSKGLISFEKKEFEKSLEFFFNAYTGTMIFMLDQRKYTAMIYYETNSFEPLVSLLQAYSQFLKSSKSGNETIINRHKAFVYYLKLLMKMKMNDFEKSEPEFLKEKIKTENVSSKEWLLSKLNEFNVPDKKLK